MPGSTSSVLRSSGSGRSCARGVAEGIEREAVSDMRMRHASLIQAAHEGHAIGELENGISELRLSFEHWLARIDADYARRGT
jgi:hypothetical protein